MKVVSNLKDFSTTLNIHHLLNIQQSSDRNMLVYYVFKVAVENESASDMCGCGLIRFDWQSNNPPIVMRF